MSAAPNLYPNEPEATSDKRVMNVRNAATFLGVSESTLRRVVKQASEAQGSATRARCEYRGQAFTATRPAERQPWQLRFTRPASSGEDVTEAAVARVDGRIAELRVAMLPVAQEPALDHTPYRPWWKFWAKSQAGPAPR